MGSSLLLRGGSSTPKSIEETISVAHSFIDGDVVRFDPADSTWKLAQANTAENSEVVGVVSNAQAGSFKITYAGYISLSRYAAISSPVLFLDAEVAGNLTGSPPSAIGTVVKPVLTRSTGTSGFIVMNYLGTQIGGSSTVSIEEIQPVGTIMPYAAEGTVPETWLECNGASYGVTEYPELYSSLLYSTGVPRYGCVVTVTLSNASGVAVGQTVLQVSPVPINGTVVSVSGNDVSVQIIATYSTTTRNFSFPSSVFSTGTNNTNFATTTKSITAVGAITHFNTPDLRGRFPLGFNSTGAQGNLPADNDPAVLTSVGTYVLGAIGGEQNNALGNGKRVPLGSGTDSQVVETPTTFGTGILNNIPPYLAIRYIIKASPYTRAAIIDGVDIPYDQLLVGDLRSGLLRNAGVGEDLIFKTNTSVATTGTERMRLTNGGNLGIGTTTPTAAFEVIGGVSASGAMSGSRLSVSAGISAGTDIVSTSGNLHLLNTSSAGVATKTGPLHLGVATGLDNGAIANDKIGLTVKTDKLVGVNGIYDPSTSLSVLSQGEGNILSGGVRVWRSASSGAGNPNTAYVSLDADSNGGAILSWGDGFRFKTGATGANNATTDRMFIKNDGKVGINTSTPASQLDVNGDIRATQLTTSGGITVGSFAASNVMPKVTGTVRVSGTTVSAIGDCCFIEAVRPSFTVPGGTNTKWLIICFQRVVSNGNFNPVQFSGVYNGQSVITTDDGDRQLMGFGWRIA